MKTKLIVAGALWLAALVVEAQDLKPFWVIETNVQKQNGTIVRIYDQQNNLIHEESLKGQSLNIVKRRDRKLLDRKVKEILRQEAVASGYKKRDSLNKN
jgi:hypothetical protein